MPLTQLLHTGCQTKKLMRNSKLPRPPFPEKSPPNNAAFHSLLTTCICVKSAGSCQWNGNDNDMTYKGAPCNNEDVH